MPQRVEVAAADIYRQIKDMILSFALYPGTRVTENALANRFHVSRTPVREALQRLAAEGYVSIRSKQGCFVRDLDIEEINHYYEVRISLETHALDLACLVMPDAALRKLSDIWHPSRTPREMPSVEAMIAHDESFHLALANGTGNTVLAGYLKDVNDHIHIVRRLDFTDPTRIAQTYTEHHEMLTRLLARDLDGAKTLLLRHIRKSADVAKAITLTQLAQHRIRAHSK